MPSADPSSGLDHVVVVMFETNFPVRNTAETIFEHETAWDLFPGLRPADR